MEKSWFLELILFREKDRPLMIEFILIKYINL
jgi:hypothetical protein